MQAAAGYFRAAISSGAWIGPSHACHGIVTCGRGLTVCQPVDQPVGLQIHAVPQLQQLLFQPEESTVLGHGMWFCSDRIHHDSHSGCADRGLL